MGMLESPKGAMGTLTSAEASAWTRLLAQRGHWRSAIRVGMELESETRVGVT